MYITIVHVTLAVFNLPKRSSVVIIIVNQLTKTSMQIIASSHLIHSGMVKVVGLMKFLVVQLLVSHGFTETMVTLPALIILS
uniref:Uncharacterized protein n=1 Tax=Amphimedon queenslandica TaxID=400682 RepID=A0A1X7UAX8_AMPQE